MFNKVSISKKIKFYSSFATTMLIILCLYFLYGMSIINKLNDQIFNISAIEAELKQREIDHLNWANSVSIFLTDDSITEIHVNKI